MRWLYVLVAATLAAPVPLHAQNSPRITVRPPPYSVPLPPQFAFDKAGVLGGCRSPVCPMVAVGGGLIVAFEEAAQEVLRGPVRLVIINGPCYSACALFADIARTKVCVTPNASFLFHEAYHPAGVALVNGKVELVKTNLVDPPQSPDINQWVYAKYGGYPKDGFATMSFTEARRFWRLCPLPPLPRPDPRRAP